MITLKGFAVKEFLQGYLTCDSARINKTQPTPMALCTLKGRVLANGWALELTEGVGLVVHNTLAEDVMNFLKPYAMFAKCTFHSTDTPVNIEACEDEQRHLLPGWAIANEQASALDQGDISPTLGAAYGGARYGFHQQNLKPEIFTANAGSARTRGCRFR